MIKRLIVPFVLVLLAACSADDQPPVFHVEGDVSERVSAGSVEVYESGDHLGEVIYLFQADLVEGKIDFDMPVTENKIVRLSVKDEEGNTLGKAKAALEAGSFTLSWGGEGESLKFGGEGHYNNVLFYSWNNSDEYRDLIDQYNAAVVEKDALADEAQKEAFFEETMWPMYTAIQEFEKSALAAIAADDSDPLMAQLAVLNGGLSGNEALERLFVLERTLGPSVAVDRYRVRVAEYHALNEKSEQFGLGEAVQDFSLDTLGGESVNLFATLGSNKFVLLEFWASWCGPCRAEIPHMKGVYEEYADQGFEILSVSLDEERLDWEELSEDENVPWLNTSDLLAYQSPVAVDYGVTFLPKNFLVSADGVIVGVDLRQEKLEERLAELMAAHDANPEG